MLNAALGIALEVSRMVGCRYMTVDSEKEAVEFYQKKGFSIVEKSLRRHNPILYMNIPSVIDVMAPTESLSDFENDSTDEAEL